IPAFQSEIWLYDTTTMTLTRITSSVGRASVSPSLSDDGTKIAFQSSADFFGQGIPFHQFEVWLYDLTTMALTRVTTASPAGRNSQAPHVSGDGTIIGFQSTSDFLGEGILTNQLEIWLYDTAAMTLTRITSGSAGSNSSFYASLSDDGSQVAFQRNSATFPASENV
ncbi:MAG: hypothetical protein AAF485_22840, partial [Chloroflexota bacterium]